MKRPWLWAARRLTPRANPLFRVDLRTNARNGRDCTSSASRPGVPSVEALSRKYAVMGTEIWRRVTRRSGIQRRLLWKTIKRSTSGITTALQICCRQQQHQESPDEGNGLNGQQQLPQHHGIPCRYAANRIDPESLPGHYPPDDALSQARPPTDGEPPRIHPRSAR